MADLLLQACIDCWNLRSKGTGTPLNEAGLYGNIQAPFTFITTLKMPEEECYKSLFSPYVLVLATFQQGNVGYLCGVWFHMEYQLIGRIVRPFYKYNLSQWNPRDAKFKLLRNRSAAIELEVDGVCHQLDEINNLRTPEASEVYPTQCYQCHGNLINVRTYFRSPAGLGMYIYQPAMCDHCQVRYSRSDRRWICTRPTKRNTVEPCRRVAPCDCSVDPDWIRHKDLKIGANEIERYYDTN